MGTVVRATCDTPNSTVTITGLGAEAVVGEEKSGYAEVTISEEYLTKLLTLTATATVDGEDGPITSDSTSIDIEVVEAPKTITEVLTYDVFKDSKGVNATSGSSSYEDYSFTSEITGISYYANMATGNESIQLRSSKNTVSGKTPYSGLFASSNPQGCILKKVTVEWNSNTASGRTLDIYGDNTNYESTSDLYNVDGHSIKGTNLGSLEMGPSTVLDITNDFSFVGLRSHSGAMYISKITLEWEKPEAPETTDVTLAWGEMANEFTVGETGATGELTVEPAEALPYVKVTSSDEEVATAEFDAETGLVELNFLKASAEPVVITATVDDPDGKYVAKENATFSFTVKDAEVALEPEAIVVTPALDDDGYITVTTGSKITFSSKNAAKLSVSIDGEETLEANPFVFTATDDTEIVVIPVDSEGKPYEALKLEAYILVETPVMTTSTYTFDFTNEQLIDKDNEIYNNPNSLMYFRSEDPGIFDMCAQIMDGSGTLSYLDNIGWKYGTDLENGAEYYISVYPHDNLDYSIISLKFNYTTDYEELVDFSDMDGNSIENGVWSGTQTPEGFKVLALDEFILNSIDVTFEHEVVKMPTLIGGTQEMGLALTHEKEDHTVFFKITDASGADVTADRMLTGAVASAPARAISLDSDHDGHTQYIAGSEFTMKPSDTLTTYAQHPHGMVSEVYSTTYEDIATGIGSIAADSETEVVYFNMQGVRVTEPTEGVYIRVANGKATKVVK